MSPVILASFPLNDTMHKTYHLLNNNNNNNNLKSSIDKVSVISEHGSDFTNVTPSSSIDYIDADKQTYEVNSLTNNCN